MATSVPPASGGIFISYRRQETAYPAGWLFDRLVRHYGEGHVFKDVDSIELGDDFVEVVTEAVSSCVVLLALIGDEWVTIADEHGQRRLDRTDDFVRIEVEAALTRDVRVIPILVDGAAMPKVEELPPSLARLVRRQALELSPSRFAFDTNRLLKVLDTALGLDAAAAPESAGELPNSRAQEPPFGTPADVAAPEATPLEETLAVALVVGEPPDPGPSPASPPPASWLPPPPVRRQMPPRSLPPRTPPGPRPPRPAPAAKGPRRKPMSPLLIGAVGAGVVVIAATALLLVPGSDPEAPSRPELAGATDTAATAARNGSTGTPAAPATTAAAYTPQVATIKVGRNASGVAITPGSVWVSNYDDGTVTQLDPADGHVIATIPVGKGGGDIVACADSVWVISDSRLVARLDPATGKVAGRFQMGATVVDLAVRCGDSLWASAADGSIRRLRQGATNAENYLRPSTDLLSDIDVDGQGVLWTSATKGNAVLRIDPDTKDIQRIAVAPEPIGIAASQPGTLWVTSSAAHTVSRIDPASNKVVATYPVGQQPWGAAVGLGAVWVTNLGGDSVSRIDDASGKVTPIPVGAKPDGVAIGHGAVWVANGGSGTISRIT